MQNRYEYSIVALSLIVISIQLVLHDYVAAIFMVAVLFILLRHPYTMYIAPSLAVVAGFLLVLTANILSACFVGVLGYLFYRDWGDRAIKLNGRVIMHHLDQRETQYYATLLLIFIGFDFFFAFTSGKTIMEVISPLFLVASISSTMLFLAVITFLRKIKDGVCFLVSFYIMNILAILFSSITSNFPLNEAFLGLLIPVLQITICLFFIKENQLGH
ncbi:MAG: hypothetical protein JJV90_00400 [Spiroplasma sp.]|nr:hypothetical protein [Mycoplasmatales bacterium]